MTWYKDLHNKYIHLFELTKETESIKAYPVRGIECGEGWKTHIVDFLESCEWIIRHNNTIHNPDYDENDSQSCPCIDKDTLTKIKIFQIKEKFGQLRCYATVIDGTKVQEDQLEIAIAKLEAKCSLTCERCGKLQHNIINSSSGWVTCLCDECREKKRDYDEF